LNSLNKAAQSWAITYKAVFLPQVLGGRWKTAPGFVRLAVQCSRTNRTLRAVRLRLSRHACFWPASSQRIGRGVSMEN